MGNANDLLLNMMAGAAKAPRCIRQLEIERELVKLSPDANEASELLDALIAGLKNKVDEFTLGDVLHHAEKLKVALKEVSNKEAIDWLCSKEGRLSDPANDAEPE